MDIKNISNSFNKIAENYDKQRRIFIPCFDDFYGTSVSFLASCRNDFKSIIDLGAGTGLLTKYLFEKYPNANYTLVDISDKMLEIAKLRFKDFSNYEFIISDYTEKLPNKTFDLVSSALSIHHLENDSRVNLYKMIYDSLEPGGYFINLDQFNFDSTFFNSKFVEYWHNFIETSNTNNHNLGDWKKRRELDKENTIDETKSILKSVGFVNAECIYCYMKFGVILAVK